MTDIVDRLRVVLDKYDRVGWHPVVEDAIDEIERLRRVVRLADPGGQVRAKLDHDLTGKGHSSHG
jgi:hypothetical protein